MLRFFFFALLMLTAMPEMAVAGPPPDPPGPFDFILDALRDEKVRNELASFLVPILIVGLGVAKVRLNILRDRLGDPTFVRPRRRYHTIGVNVVLVGLGGSGKTSLLRALSACSKADPARATRETTTYSIVQELDVVTPPEEEPFRRILRIYVNDYEGQEGGIVVHDNAVKERETFIPSTVLVIVVDLFDVPAGNGDLAPRPVWDKKRVKEHLAAYNDQYLSSIKMISRQYKAVCLFVNKCDLILPFGVDTEGEILEAYKPLRGRLDDTFSFCDSYEIVGSGASGEGVVGYNLYHGRPETLLEVIVSYAKPMKRRKWYEVRL